MMILVQQSQAKNSEAELPGLAGKQFPLASLSHQG
jgi:hypothetical protein